MKHCTCFAAGLSLDVIDGTAEKPAKLEIQRLREAKVYVVKISGQAIQDDYLIGTKMSLEFHYHSLVMKTGSERPEEIKIQVEVSAMSDKGYKLDETSTTELSKPKYNQTLLYGLPLNMDTSLLQTVCFVPEKRRPLDFL